MRLDTLRRARATRLAGAPLDLRHVLSGECAEGATSEERAHAATLLSGMSAALPLQADVH